MSTVDPTNLVQTPEDYSAEVARARHLAERYRLPFVHMEEFRIDPDLFRLFVESGVYREYAEQYLKPEQIDEVDVGMILEGAVSSA